MKNAPILVIAEELKRAATEKRSVMPDELSEIADLLVSLINDPIDMDTDDLSSDAARRANYERVTQEECEQLEGLLQTAGGWVTTPHLLAATGWRVRHLRAVASAIDAVSDTRTGGYIAFDNADLPEIHAYVEAQTTRATGNALRARRLEMRLRARLAEEKSKRIRK